jgi:hypothetical protein
LLALADPMPAGSAGAGGLVAVGRGARVAVGLVEVAALTDPPQEANKIRISKETGINFGFMISLPYFITKLSERHGIHSFFLERGVK